MENKCQITSTCAKTVIFFSFWENVSIVFLCWFNPWAVFIKCIYLIRKLKLLRVRISSPRVSWLAADQVSRNKSIKCCTHNDTCLGLSYKSTIKHLSKDLRKLKPHNKCITALTKSISERLGAQCWLSSLVSCDDWEIRRDHISPVLVSTLAPCKIQSEILNPHCHV